MKNPRNDPGKYATGIAPVYAKEFDVLHKAVDIPKRSGGDVPSRLRASLRYEAPEAPTSSPHLSAAATPEKGGPIREPDLAVTRNQNRYHNSFDDSTALASAGFELNLECMHFDIQVAESTVNMEGLCLSAAFPSQTDHQHSIYSWRDDILDLDFPFVDPTSLLADSQGGSGGSLTIPTPPETPQNHEREALGSPQPDPSACLSLIAPELSAPIRQDGPAFAETVLIDRIGQTRVVPRNSLPLRESRVRVRRRKFQDPRIREATGETRKLKACVRCRMQRIRCIKDPADPTGPCLSCSKVISTIVRLPCLRYKITDSTLYRTDLNAFSFYKNHPMVGPEYGDFHIPKTWVNDSTELLEVTQDRGSIWSLEVRQFIPPVNDSDRDLKGRPMYFVPWAIADPETAAAALNRYIDESVGSYLDTILDDSDHLVWDIFHSALRLSMFPTPVKILEDVLRLWVACRFIESGWRCCGNEMLNSQDVKDPYRGDDWISPPPYIDYQMSSIIMQLVLAPLRRATLNSLQKMILANKPSNWYIIFLTTFILLHNYELSIAFQRGFSARRQCSLRYIDMPLVRASHSGAKTILAHFHYCCKGQEPFRRGFDWRSIQTQRMVQLDAEQIAFMERYAALVNNRAPSLKAVSRTDRYEDRFWFVGQLFDSSWFPRDTYEHSPPA